MQIQQNSVNQDVLSFTGPWVQYQQIRLARLRQQRQRMESMKEVVENYSRIISQLELKNRTLLEQNQRYRLQLQQYEEGFNGIFNSTQFKLELQKQQMLRKNLEKANQQLKQDIAIFSVGQTYTKDYQIEYQSLRELYEELKSQVYVITKQNIELKDVIYYQSQNFKISDSSSKHNAKQDKNIRIQISAENQFSPKKSNNSALQNSSKSRMGSSQKDKIEQLKLEIGKQYELIQKFKANQIQQLQLIELLKNQKSKVCLCHSHGYTSSKRIIMQMQKPLKSLDTIKNNL